MAYDRSQSRIPLTPAGRPIRLYASQSISMYHRHALDVWADQSNIQLLPTSTPLASICLKNQTNVDRISQSD